MKILLKIYGKYIAVTWLIVVLLLAVNGGIFFSMVLDEYRKIADTSVTRLSLKKTEERIFGEREGFAITPEGEAYLAEQGICFLLVLNDGGDVVFAWNQPEGFAGHYTAGEIAAFSRWYLHDYPVRVYRGERGLLVAGFPKDSLWKYPVEISLSFMGHIGDYFRLFLLLNLLAILLVVACLGYGFYRTMQPLTKGIMGLSQNQQVTLSEKGATGSLAQALNQTSRTLRQQRERLQKRDEARQEWIAGISHDVRTPLALIVGYADELEQDASLPEQERRKAGQIKKQSMQLGQLVEDLNLASRLEYQMQPLQVRECYPAQLLRGLTAEVLNSLQEEAYEISLQVDQKLEGVRLWADEKLLARAIRNLLGNCIRHNPNGCQIWVGGILLEKKVVLTVEDNGAGIPRAVQEALLAERRKPLGEDGERGTGSGEMQDREEQSGVHVMGLKITRQILQAHGGAMEVKKEGRLVKLSLPLATNFQDFGMQGEKNQAI